jgi:hypothetical protein
MNAVKFGARANRKCLELLNDYKLLMKHPVLCCHIFVFTMNHNSTHVIVPVELAC